MKHEDCLDTFCLWPLHPGPCRGTTMRQNPRMAPGAQHGRARVGAPPPNNGGAGAGGPAQRPAAGRARVGAPPAKAQGPAQGRARVGAPPPPAKKTARKATKKAAPRKAAPRRRDAAADAGGAVLMMMGGSSSVNRDRFAETVMNDVRRALARDRETGDTSNNSEYSQAITRAALQMSRVLANEAGGTPQERRRNATRIANVVNDAMRTGDVSKIAALKRELGLAARTASAARFALEAEALALYGLQLEVPSYWWNEPPPALVASPLMHLAHVDCGLSVFCRNPLHPGPCKGWKGTLAKVAPGALAVIEAERKKKLAAKQAAKAKAQAAAKKVVDQAKRGVEVDAHPAAKKKLAAKTVATILGDDEEKVTAIEGKTKLSKKEIAWHANKKAAALLAANIAAGNLKTKAARQKYRQTVRAQIIAALEADNETGATGPDSEYQKVIAGWSQAASHGHADKHVELHNEPTADLHAAVAEAFDAAIQQDLKDAKAGSTPVNLKKLEKALAAIPGNAGEDEHDIAVGKAVGHDYTPAEPDEPELPEGALSDEEAEKLATGAEGILDLLGTTPEAKAKTKANVKAKAQSEGFAAGQEAMVEKTATNNSALLAGQMYDGLDGFSPQGKKKFEKLLAGELQAMLVTGDPKPKPGSLAELVAMKKSGAISADEFHEQVMKKLKIKSKKLNPNGSPKEAPTPAPAPGTPESGGAGAGGSPGKAQGAAASDMAQAIGPGAIDNGPWLGNVLSSSSESDADKADMIDGAAGGLAQNLMDSLPTQSLNADEHAALFETVKAMIKSAIDKPASAPPAVDLIKMLKTKNGPELKKLANAMVPPAKKDAGTSAPKSKQGKADALKSATAAIDKALGTNEILADDAADAEATNFMQVGDEDEDAIVKGSAKYLASIAVTEGNGTKIPQHQAKALKEKAAAVFEKAMKTGDPADIAEAEAFAKLLKNGSAAQLAWKSQQPTGDPVVNAINDVDGPLATKPDAVAQAVHIAANLKKAYEQLTDGDDGSALASSAAIKALADSISNGATPEAKAKQAAYALAKQIVAAKVAGKSGMPALHEQALVNELAAEIEAGILSGDMEGPLIKSLGTAKGGFTKIKIKAKQAFQKNGGLTPGGGSSSMPLLPTSSKDAALDKALADAFDDPNAFSDPSAPPMPAEVDDGLVDAVAGLPGVPKSVKAKINELADAYNAASPADKPAAAKALAKEMAATALGNVMDQLDILANPMIDQDEATKMLGVHLAQIENDYLGAIEADAQDVGGMASSLQAAVQHTQKLGDDLASANAYDPKGMAVSHYKLQTVAAMLDLAAKTNTTAPATTKPGGGAGAGGSGTGVTPVVAPAGSGVAKPKVDVKSLPKGTATFTAPTAAPPPTPTADTLAKKKAKAKKPALTPLAPAGPAPDLATAKKVGAQGGSNPGGQYEAADGTRYYVKQQKSAAHARNEAMSSALYRAAGVETPPVHYTEGTVGELSGSLTASRMIPGATPFDPKNKAHVAAVRRGFAVDAWLGNWDVAGMSMDNIVIDADGNPHRIDLGGSMEYRAQGSPKGAAFGDTVGEIDSLRNASTNPSAAKIFGDMSDDEMIDAMEQVEAIDPQTIRDTVAAQGGDPALAEKLIRRREDIVKRLKQLREDVANTPAPGPLGTPVSTKPDQVKLGGTQKKQLILKPQGGYPISQVVLEGHEGEVYEYNQAVEGGANGQAAAAVPLQMSSFPSGSPARSSLYSYTTSSGCDQINGHLRAGGQPAPNPGDGTSSAADRVAQLDAAFETARLGEPITTLRGFSGSEDIFGDLWTTHRDRNWAGTELRDLAYSSSSVNMSTARSFAGAGYSQSAVVMRIHMPAGTRAVNLGGASAYASEAEILLNRGARFRIVADNGWQNGARHLDVEVICDGEGCADTA